MEIRKEILDSVVNLDRNNLTLENANIDAATPSGEMMKFASVAAKQYAHDYLLSDEARQAVDDNLIHVHDLDYYGTKSTTCLQHPLDKVLSGGFTASDGTARPAKRIETAGALAAISIQTITNEQHGGQAIPAFDFYLAPYIRATFKEELYKLSELGKKYDYDEQDLEVLSEMEFVDYDSPISGYGEEIVNPALENTVKRVHQAMEALIHNLNTMRSRGGGQVPFSSINYGTDTSPEGRCIIRELLKSTWEGVGNGQTAIFPIQVFKVKKGVNLDPGDPNYDLLVMATQVSAKRFFPTYVNLDASFNKSPLWNASDPERYKYEVATMGCRTRVFEDRFGDSTSIGRGNLSFTTINLPRLALMYPNYAEFLEKLEETVDLVVRQLVDRYKWQCSGLKEQFPMLMSGMWVGSENLKGNETVESVLKHGTLGVGFIGLAECLVALCGYHHGEDTYAQRLGLTIVKEMSDRCKYWANKLNLNISLFATPAEGLSGKFVPKDRKDFGVIPGVTDRDFYTNSNHVPVYCKIPYVEKLKIEAPYHKLTPGGHIAYVEVDGDAENNPQAIMDIVRLMVEYDIGYGAVNFARARCLDCGYEDGSVKFDKCPKCGSENVDIIERVTGYLTGTTSRWNAGKRAELNARVSHTTGNSIV